MLDVRRLSTSAASTETEITNTSALGATGRIWQLPLETITTSKDSHKARINTSPYPLAVTLCELLNTHAPDIYKSWWQSITSQKSHLCSTDNFVSLPTHPNYYQPIWALAQIRPGTIQHRTYSDPSTHLNSLCPLAFESHSKDSKSNLKQYKDQLDNLLDEMTGKNLFHLSARACLTPEHLHSVIHHCISRLERRDPLFLLVGLGAAVCYVMGNSIHKWKNCSKETKNVFRTLVKMYTEDFCGMRLQGIAMDATKHQVINPPQKVKPLEEQSYFASARTIAALIEQHDSETATKLILDLCNKNLAKTALTLVDAYSLISAKPEMRKENSVASEIFDRACRYSSDFSRLVLTLPTVDAIKFRASALQMDLKEAACPTVAAFVGLNKHENRATYWSDLPERMGRFLIPREDKNFISDVSGRLTALGRYEDLLSHEAHVIRDFYDFASTRYPTETFGYGSVYERLCKKDTSKNWSAVKSVQPQILYDLDPSSGLPHNCFHTALAGRSFLSNCGIPSEVYTLTLGTANHSVTVAFFPRNDRWLPVIVDASPYNGTYKLTPGSINNLTPQPLDVITNTLEFDYPIEIGALGYGVRGALIPWHAKDIDRQTRIITYAGASHELVEQVAFPARGTDAFYGRGPKNHYPVFTIDVVFPDGTRPEVSLMIKYADGKPILDETPSDKLTKTQLDLIITSCNEQLPRLTKMLRNAEVDGF